MKKLLIILLSMCLFVSLALAMPPATMKMLEVVAAKNDVVPGGEITVTSATANASTGTDIAITHGLTIASGDVLVAVINANSQDVTGTVADNNGSTPFTITFEEVYNNANILYCVRVAGASEPSVYHFTADVSASWGITLLAIKGADTSTPWDVAPSAVTRNAINSDGGTETAPTMTVTAGALGILSGVADGSTSGLWTAPSNSYANEVTVSANRSMTLWYRIWESAGATGTSTAFYDAISEGALHQIAIKAAQ